MRRVWIWLLISASMLCGELAVPPRHPVIVIAFAVLAVASWITCVVTLRRYLDEH
jgi:hypothetical protein